MDSEKKAQVEPKRAFREFYELEQGVLRGYCPVKIKKSNSLFHNFFFLKIPSGTEVMISMIHRQNHFT